MRVSMVVQKSGDWSEYLNKITESIRFDHQNAFWAIHDY